MPDVFESRASFHNAWSAASSVPLNIADDGRVDLQEHEYPGTLLLEVLNQKGLSSNRRLDAYRTQYWFRLISILQQEMPLTVHMLGHTSFNRLAQEYISLYPTPGGMLSHIGRHWLQFIKTHTQNSQVIQASEVDRAYYEVFIGSLDAPKTQPLTLDMLQKALEGTPLDLVMPDTVRLIALDYDLLKLREQLRGKETAGQAAVSKSANQQIPNPPRQPTKHFLIHRQGENIHTIPLQKPAGAFFAAIRSGTSWEDALDSFSTEWLRLNPEKSQRELPVNSFFREIISKGWLVQLV